VHERLVGVGLLVSGAEQVARMPRLIGTRVGVKLTLTGAPAAWERFCTISGVCRWTPPTPYALTEPITSLPIRFGLADLPAPLVPLAATTTTSGVTRPAASAGAIARVTEVG
jgi:hypothetical protein